MVAALAACGQSAPAPAATAPATKAAAPASAATSAPAKAAEATKPAEAAAKKVDFPQKGKAITNIVGAAAGGPNDLASRLLAPLMEKDLGVPVNVVNKGGAGQQIGLTEVALAKPDGYTLGYYSFPQINGIYLDPERKAAFKRTDLQPLALHAVDPGVLGVPADSPFKTVKELVDAAKANPGTIKIGSSGLMSDDHIAVLKLEQLTGAKFAVVQFESSAPATAALLGGHIDALAANVSELPSHVKSGKAQVLGVMDKEESRYLPGVKTFEAQGYKLYNSSSRGLLMPAGAPKEVSDTLAASIKKAMDAPEHKQKMDELFVTQRYMDAAQFTTFWDEIDAEVAKFLAETKTKS